MVMHNLNQAVRYADQLAVLDDGKIVSMARQRSASVPGF